MFKLLMTNGYDVAIVGLIVFGVIICMIVIGLWPDEADFEDKIGREK